VGLTKNRIIKYDVGKIKRKRLKEKEVKKGERMKNEE